MTRSRLVPAVVGVSLALATELTLGLSLGTPAHAQFKPPRFGAPRTTAGGATRSGSCMTEKTPLTALVPRTRTGALGLTTQERPSFFVYLPKTTARTAEFTLKDINSKDIYRTRVQLSGQSGVVRWQLPPEAPALESGKTYQWFFNVVCQPSDRLRDDFVTAWIERVPLEAPLTNALKTATPRQRPNLYAQAGIWQDTLAGLSDLRRAQPTDSTITKEWADLLNSVGLGQVSAAPPMSQLSLRNQRPR